MSQVSARLNSAGRPIACAGIGALGGECVQMCSAAPPDFPMRHRAPDARKTTKSLAGIGVLSRPAYRGVESSLDAKETS